MSKKCARCEKTVYPLEELKCLDKIWHKGCFKCHECGMTLNMKTYKGFNKLPYCEAHIPKAKATTVAETPESRRLAENTKNQSNVQYHADFEKNKAKFTQVADDPETARLKKNTKIISNVSYHGTLEQKADMERKRTEDDNGTTEQQYDGGDSTSVPVQPPQHNSPQHHSPPHPAPVPQHSPQQQYGSSSDSDVPAGKGRSQYYEEEGVEDDYHGGVEVPEYNTGHPQRGYHNHNNQQNYSSSPHGHGATPQQQGGVVIRSGGVAVRGGSVGGGGSGQGSNRSSSELSSHGHYPPNTNRHSQGSYPQYPPTNNQYTTGAPVPREDLQRQQLQLQQQQLQQQQQQREQMQREQLQQQQQQQQLLQQQKQQQQQQQQQLLLQQQQQQQQQQQHQQQYNNVPPQQQSHGAPPSNAHPHRHPQQPPNTQSYLHHQHQQPQPQPQPQQQHNHHNQHPQTPQHNHAPPQNVFNDANHNNSPYSGRTSQTLIYTSQTGPVEAGGGHRVGSIVDYDPMNEQYGSVAPKQNSAGGGYRQQQTYQVQRSNLYGGDPGQGQPQQVAAPPQVNSNAAPQQHNNAAQQQHNNAAQQQHNNAAQQQHNNAAQQQHKVNAPPTQLGRCYRAQYDYEAADTDEVSFRDGDLIVNCTPIDEGWMTGQVQRSGQTGMLPANYVERVS